MTATRRPALPLPDWLRAIASQLIIAHHLAWYGPLAVSATALWPGLFGSLQSHGRLAVQVFLVVAGYLAARGLAPSPFARSGPGPAEWAGLVWQRYWRLARPYGVALLAALAAAGFARAFGSDPDTPAAPSAPALLANLFFLQDLLGVPALSAGFWYVAIDLQLFALFAALVALRRIGRTGSALNRAMRVGSVLGTVGLMLASMLWLNLDSLLDAWAPYFFAAYGLGVAACWIHAQPRRTALLLALAALVAAALVLDWRERLAVAGLTALLLAWQPAGERLARHAWHPMMRWLARVSYGSFLLHYPLLLLVGTAVDRVWPDQPLPAALALVLTWALSLGAGWAVHRWVERPHAAPRSRQPVASRSFANP
ncbi:acyltransferase family protein [Ideonella sp. 4Y11]|uniref:Acyltransferase family protein n=1 Tax=Ideonella aquatica TaxID=2824119 RepID=A0A941BLD3_9BURK|nr:acyltransferase family protein [Ideonella aquatica]MBQ0959579.1 acyltransferase family protein [Ideonella aquatica]